MTSPRRRLRVVCVGGGGHCRSILSSLLLQKDTFDVAGVLDGGRNVGDVILPSNEAGGGADVVVVGSDHDALCYRDVDGVVIALGDNVARMKAAERLTGVLGRDGVALTFPSVVHPTAYVAHGVNVCRGAVVCASAVVDVGSTIGAFSVVNNKCCVSHDCVVGEAAFIAPGATLCGEVHVGAMALVGAGATVVQCVHIGRGAVVGAGAVVLANVDERSVSFGVPAKHVRTRLHDEKVFKLAKT